MENPSDLFGEYVFNDSMMQKRLPKETYRALKRTIEQGRSLDPAVAGVVANAMKDWALEMGATHYTHWFQPVSYTHLDVYKRQPDEEAYYARMQRFATGKGTADAPVSYTPLVPAAAQLPSPAAVPLSGMQAGGHGAGACAL